MYLTVDFLTPLIFIAVAGILVLFAIPLGISALVRRKKFSTLADGFKPMHGAGTYASNPASVSVVSSLRWQRRSPRSRVGTTRVRTSRQMLKHATTSAM